MSINLKLIEVKTLILLTKSKRTIWSLILVIWVWVIFSCWLFVRITVFTSFICCWNVLRRLSADFNWAFSALKHYINNNINDINTKMKLDCLKTDCKILKSNWRLSGIFHLYRSVFCLILNFENLSKTYLLQITPLW